MEGPNETLLASHAPARATPPKMRAQQRVHGAGSGALLPSPSPSPSALPPLPPQAAAARANGATSPPMGSATSPRARGPAPDPGHAAGVLPLTSGNVASLASLTPHSKAQGREGREGGEGGGSPRVDRERPARRSQGSAAEVLARHRQLAASLPPRKSAGEPPQDSPPSMWSPAHVEPVSSLKSRDLRRSRSPPR